MEHFFNIWERDNYYVREESFDHDLHVFVVYHNDTDEVLGKIVPGDASTMDEIISGLNAGADVDGWEDGSGDQIRLPFN